MNKFEKRRFVKNFLNSIETYIIYVINKGLIPENMDKKEFAQYFKKLIEQKIKEL
jgi:hypothetical protein